MLQGINEAKSEFSYSCNERAILAISALKLGYQSFMDDLRSARAVGDITKKEFRLHSRWYCNQIKIFNNRIDKIGRITESEVVPLEVEVLLIIVTGIYLSTNGSEPGK